MAGMLGKIMDLYLAGTGTRPYVLNQYITIEGGGRNGYLPGWRNNWESCPDMEKNSRGGGTIMDLFIAGNHPLKQGADAPKWTFDCKILESFFYCKDNPYIPRIIPGLKKFLLDSGAFSFLQGQTAVDWDRYIEDYAEFINRFNIDLFFELDIDSVVGLQEVERLRAKLERLTGKQPIPVWHIGRGKEYFLEQMCGNYPYVALGGIVGAKKGSQAYKQYQAAFPWFIREAHIRGVKIHGLGFTSLEGLKKYHFDSVDSTAWLYGNRGGYLYKFNQATGEMGKIPAPSGHRLKSQDAARWNFNEWIKFQRYAEKHY